MQVIVIEGAVLTSFSVTGLEERKIFVQTYMGAKGNFTRYYRIGTMNGRQGIK